MSILEENRSDLKGESVDGIFFEEVEWQNEYLKKWNMSLKPNVTKKEKYYISVIDGFEKYYDYGTQSVKGAFVEDAITILTSQFDMSNEISFFLKKNHYSMLIMSIRETRRASTKFSPVGVALFHYSPSFGVFCPLLAVRNDYQRVGVGKSLLGRLQSYHCSVFKDLRMCVWMYFISDEKGNCDKGFSLYSYYQRMGLHLVNPREIPIDSILPNELRDSINRYQVLIEEDVAHNDTVFEYNFILGSYLKLHVYDKQAAITFQKAVTKVKNTDFLGVKSEHSCDVCGLSNNICMTSKKMTTFLLCGYKYKSSSRTLESRGDDKLTPICGSFMCFTCHSNFGYNSVMYCPVHLTSEEKGRYNSVKHQKTMTKNMSNDTSKLLCSTKPKHRQNFFRPKHAHFVYGQENDTKPIACKHCHLIALNKLLPKHTSYLDGENLDGDRGYSTDYMNNFKQMRKIYDTDNTECVVHKNTKHARCFSTNAGNRWSLISNSVFAIKTVDAQGDCGILCLKYAIESLSRNEFDEITTQMIIYVSNQMKNLILKTTGRKSMTDQLKKKIMSHYPKDTELTVESIKSLSLDQQVTVSFLRCMIFLSKIDLKYIDMIMDDDSSSYDQKQSLFHTWFDDLIVATAESEDAEYLHMKACHKVGIAEVHEVLVKRCQMLKNTKDLKNNEIAFMELIGKHANIWGDIYGKNSFNNEKQYYVTTMDLWCIPYITRKKIGLVYAVHHSSHKDMSSQPLFYDGGYNYYLNKCLLSECSNFILIRSSQNLHYDLVIDIVNENAVHPVPDEESDLAMEKYMAYNKVLTMLTKNDRSMLLGDDCASINTKETYVVDEILLEIPDIYDYCKIHPDVPKLSKCQDLLDKWLTKSKQKKFEQSELYMLANSGIPWLEHARRWLNTNELLDTSNYQQVSLHIMSAERGKFIPIVMKGTDFDDTKDSLYGIGYIQKQIEYKLMNGKKNLMFNICDFNKQSFIMRNDEFVTKYIQHIKANNKKLFRNDTEDGYDHKTILELFKNEQISFVSDEVLMKMIRNVVYSTMRMMHGKDGSFTQDIFEKIQQTPEPVVTYKLRRSMKDGFKTLCSESVGFKWKQIYYTFYVAYSKQEDWVHRHLRVYGMTHISVVQKVVFKKYPKLIENSYILQTPQSLKTSIVRFFMKAWDNQKQMKMLLKRVAKILCHKFFLTLTTCKNYIDKNKMNDFDKETTDLMHFDNDSVVTSTDATTIISETSTILNDVTNELKAKKFPPNQYHKTNKTDSIEYDSETSDDTFNFSEDDDDGSERVSSNIDHTTNWYKVPIMCEDHEFKKILCLDEESPFLNDLPNLVLLKNVSEQRISVEKIILIFTNYRKKENYLLHYVCKYMKDFVEDTSLFTNLKKIIKYEWMNVVKSVNSHMGICRDDTIKDECFHFRITDNDIENERKKMKAVQTRENVIGVKTNTPHSTYKWSDFYNNKKIGEMDESNIKQIEEAVRTIATSLKKSHDECKEFSIDGYHFYNSAVFQKRPPSDIFEYPNMSDLNETIFVLERQSIRVTNAIDMLDNSKSLRINEIDLLTKIFNEEHRDKTDCICIPIKSYYKFYEKNHKTIGIGTIDKDLIQSLVDSIGSFLHKNQNLKDKFKLIAFISPNLNQSPFHYALVLIDIEKNIIRIVNGTDVVVHELASTFFFNIISIILLLFFSWDNWNGNTLKNLTNKYSFQPPDIISSYNENLHHKASSAVLLMNVFGYISGKLQLQNSANSENITLYDHQNLKFFRNFIVSILMHYSGCRNITARWKEICSTGYQDNYFSAMNLLSDIIKLNGKNAVPISVKVTTSKDPNHDNKSSNDMKSTKSIKSVSSLENDESVGGKNKVVLDSKDDFQFEEKHLANFHGDNNHSLRQKVGGKERRKTVTGKTKKSIHCGNKVEDFSELKYEMLPKQKKALKKLPMRTKRDIENEPDREKFNQNNVHSQIGFVLNKLPCTHICFLDSKYAVTSSTNVVKARLSREMNEDNMTEADKWNDLMRLSNVFPLEAECIDAVATNKDNKITSFLRILKGKKEWIKMSKEFSKKYKHFLKEKKSAWAYHYMNFHAIKYNRTTKDLSGICYHKKNVVYSEVIKRSYVRHIENYHRQYMIAIAHSGQEVALNIGKGNDSSKKQKIIASTRKNSGRATRALTNLPPMIDTTSPSTSNTQPYTQHNLGERSKFQCIDTIQFHQGNKHRCFEYSILSALQNLIIYYKFQMQDSSKIVCNKISNLQQDIMNNIHLGGEANTVLHNMKQTMDKHHWSVLKVCKEKKYLCTNFTELHDFCEKHEMSIITVRIDDTVGNNSHWVCINYMYVFNTVWKKPVPLTKQNLMRCAENDTYKQLGMIYM